MYNHLRKKIALVMALLMFFSNVPFVALAGSPTGGIKEGSDPEPIAKIMLANPVATHTYTFMVEGAQWGDVQIVKDGQYLVTPQVPEKADHKFIGWLGEDQYGDPVEIKFETPITVDATKNITATPQFVKVYYVFFMDGTGPDARVFTTKDGTTDVSVSTDVTLPISSTQAVTGWYKDKDLEDGPVGANYTIGNADQTLWPKIEEGHYLYFVSGENGTYIEPQFVAPNGTTTEPAMPTRPGYEFQHWSLTEEGSAYDFGQKIDDNKTLYAVWTPEDVNFTINYWIENADDTNYSYEGKQTGSGLTGTNIVLSPAQYSTNNINSSYRAHFTFKEYDQNKQISGDGSTIVNVYFSRKTYDLTFYSRSSSWPYSYVLRHTITAKYGAEIKDEFPIPGYPGRAWKCTDTSTFPYALQTLDRMPGKNLRFNLYDQSSYTLKTIYYYVENIDGTGNLLLKEVETYFNYITYEEEYHPILGYDRLSPQAAGFFSFQGNWRKDFSSNKVSLNYTRKSYNLIYTNVNTTSQVAVKYEKPMNEYDIIPQKPSGVPVAYVFGGWYLDEAFNTEYDFENETMPPNNLILYAKWAPPVVNGTFHVNKNGNGTPKETTLAYDSQIALGSMPTVQDHLGNVILQGDNGFIVTVPQNHKWIGWATKTGSNYNTYNFNTHVLDDIVLYPYYVDNSQFTVTYNAGEGTGTPPTDSKQYAEYAYADVKSADLSSEEGLKPPVGSDKVFLGWENGGTIYQPGDKIQITGNMTLTAQWGTVKDKTQVTYKPGTGATGNDYVQQCLINESIELETWENCGFTAKSGYIFNGWLNMSDNTVYPAGTLLQVDDENEDTNVLVAQWTYSVNDVIVTKKWVAGHAVDHTRVVIKLYRTPDGGTEEEVTQEPVVTPSSGTHDTFTHTWEDLPTHDANGNQYTYRAKEQDIHNSYTAVVTGEGYAFTITNTYHNIKEVEAKKYWRGLQGNKPKVWFTLYRKCEQCNIDELVPDLNAESVPPGNDTVHWQNLTGADPQGHDYTFYVKETNKHKVDFVPEGFEKEEDGLSVYNYMLTSEDVVGTKEWVGGPTPRPAVRLELWRKGGTAGNGERVEEATLVDATTNQVNFGKQRLTDINDAQYTYYVVEPNVPEDYEVSYNGLTATNTYKNTSAVTLTAPSDSKTYDGTPLTATTGVTATGLPEGFTVEATASGSQTNVGSSANVVDDGYVIKDANGIDQTAYFTNVTKVDGTLKVTKAPVTITTGSDEKEYDGTPLTNSTVEIEGLVDGESVTLTATGTITDIGNTPNTYDITWDNATAANYTVTDNLGTLTVTTNETTEVKLTAADAEKVYDGTALTKTDGVTWTGLPAGFTVEASSTGSQTNAGESANVVNDGYVIKDANGDDKTANFTNVTKVDGTLKVTKAPVTITTGSDEKEYDGTPLTNSTVEIEGLVDGESVTLTATGTITDIGNTPNTYDITWDNATAANYTVTDNLGTLTVTTNETTEVKLTAADAEKVYDGTALTKTDGVTWTGLPAGFTVEASSTGSQTNAGESANVVNDGYVIKDANGDDKTANFTNVTKVDGTLKVTKAPVTITTGSDEKEYDGTPLTNSTVEIEGLVDGESVTLTATGTITDIGNTPNTYDITWDNATAANYTVTDNLGTLTVTTNETTEVKLTAADAEKVYDGTALTKTDGVTWTGLPAGFTVEASSTGSQTNAGESANVVNDGYVIKDANGDDKTANFTNVTKVDGTLKVTKAPVTITTGSDEKEYDGTPLTNSTVEIEGLVDGESVTLTATGTITDIGNTPNTYDITWDNATAANYTVTDNLGTLTVTTNETTEVKLTAADAEKVYDGTALTKTDGVTWTGLPAGFTVEASSTGSQTNAGESANVVNDGYVIKDANGDDKTANFTNVTKVDGTLKVTKAPVTITTGSDEKEYDGTPLTNSTVEIEGLVDGESVTLTATGTITDIGNTPNTYDITWDNATAANYTVTDNLGTLTVTTNETTEVKLTAADAEKVYDGTALTKTDGVTWTGLPAGFTVEASSTGSQTNAGESANVVNDGYVIKDANGDDKTANFTNVTKVDGTLKVTKAPVTITTGSDEKEYDGTPLTNSTVEIEGLVDGESVTLTATGTITDIGNTPNTYDITWDNATAANYTVTDNLGTLTVTTNETTEVKLTAADAEKVYDGTALTKTDGVTWTGLPAGFTVEASSTGSQTNAGESANVVNDGYVIKDANGDDKTANFTNVTKVDGTLKVTKAPVTITTGSAIKKYDGSALTKDEAGITGLVNNETATVTATGSQTEVGSSTNTYSIDWGTTDPNNYAITEDLGTLTIVSLKVVKTADKDSYDTVDEVITYTITVTNDSYSTLNNIEVTDKMMNPPTVKIDSLDAGKTKTFEYTYTVKQEDLDNGSITNAVSVTSDETGEDPTETEKNIPAEQNPKMSVVKSAVIDTKGEDKTKYHAVGDKINYTIKVTNEGNVTLNNLVIIDKLVSFDDMKLEGDTNGDGNLQVDEVWILTYTHTVTQADLDRGSITNAVAVTSKETGEDPAEDEIKIIADQKASASVVKTAKETSFDKVGDVLNYTVVVENTGNITLKGLEITDRLAQFKDMKLEGDTNGDGELQVDEVWTFTYTYTVTQDDVNAGKVFNSVAVTKRDNPENPNEPNLPSTVDEHIVPGPAFLDIETTINPTKSLSGRAMKVGEFEFALRQGTTTLQRVTNDAEGNIIFPALKYTQKDIGKTYSYKIVENIPADKDKESGMTYDDKAINFTVVVSDAGNGVLSLTVSTASANVIFFNTYTAPASEPEVETDETAPVAIPVQNFDLGVAPSNVADCFE